MSNRFITLAMITIIAMIVGVVSFGFSTSSSLTNSELAVKKQLFKTDNLSWAAVAPGRVESRYGETNISSDVPGRITRIYVKLHDRVSAGQLLAEVSNDEEQAKIRAAKAEVEFRLSERNNYINGENKSEKKSLVDAIEVAQKKVEALVNDLDKLQINAHEDKIGFGVLEVARKKVADAKAELESQKSQLAVLNATERILPLNRVDFALEIARAERQLAQIRFEKTKIRAPYDGEIFQILKTVGMVSSLGDANGIFIMGDLSQMRVRAEVSATNISNIKLGQKVRLRTYWKSMQETTGVVTAIEGSLRPRSILTSTPGKLTNEFVAVVFVKPDGPLSLLPGTRLDVFFVDSVKERNYEKIITN